MHSCALPLRPPFIFGQTESQLRDPEYLIEQYNQLVAKHNALIEKTRGLIASQRKPQIVEVEAEADDELDSRSMMRSHKLQHSKTSSPKSSKTADGRRPATNTWTTQMQG